MQLLTGSEAQIDLFGHDPDLPMFKQKAKRVRSTKSRKRNQEIATAIQLHYLTEKPL